jgi:hypothetical protein
MIYQSNGMRFPIVTHEWSDGVLYSTYRCLYWFDTLEELQVWCDKISGAAYL